MSKTPATGPSDARLTREELYTRVWEVPMRTLAPQLGLSDVGLAKICRKLLIPRPWRGYWREKETGRRGRAPKLPPWPEGRGDPPAGIRTGEHTSEIQSQSFFFEAAFFLKKKKII